MSAAYTMCLRIEILQMSKKTEMVWMRVVVFVLASPKLTEKNTKKLSHNIM